MIRLVDQNDRVGRRAAHALDEVGDRLRAVHGGRRVVRVVEEDQARALARRLDHRLDVQPQARVDLHLDERVIQLLRHIRAVLERRRRGDERARRRRKGAHGILENLLRAGAKHDVLGLRVEFRGDGRGQIRFTRRAVERVASGLGKLRKDRVERHLAGPKRILVAADADFGAGRRSERARRAAVLLRFGEMRLETARGQERARELGPCPSDPKEIAARHRHGNPP